MRGLPMGEGAWKEGGGRSGQTLLQGKTFFWSRRSRVFRERQIEKKDFKKGEKQQQVRRT